MRRTAPTLPISPQLLKHFAIATLVLTGLIAMFASGEEWGAQAQLKAVDAKNKLVRTETEKLGTRKLANVLKISNAPHRSFADEDTGPPPDEGNYQSYNGGDYGSGRASFAVQAPAPIRSDMNFIPQLPQRPGATVTVRGMNAEDLPNADPAKKKRQAAEAARQPTPEQLKAIREMSRLRSGAPLQEGE